MLFYLQFLFYNFKCINVLQSKSYFMSDLKLSIGNWGFFGEEIYKQVFVGDLGGGKKFAVQTLLVLVVHVSLKVLECLFIFLITTLRSSIW